MFRSYRRIFSAFAGLALIGAAQHSPDQSNTKTGAEQNQLVSATSASQTRTSEPLYRPYPDYKADPCYHSKNHNTADLCAQWRAALAAERAAWWAGAGALLSFITVAGLIVTIWQTHGALHEARRGNRLNLLFERRARRESKRAEADQTKALDIAERNANAALAQVDLARETAEKQLRAYVIIDNIDIRGIELGLEFQGLAISAMLQNIGATPAKVFCAYSDGWIVEKDAALPQPNLAAKDKEPLNVYMGNTVTPQRFCTISFSKDELEPIARGSHRLFIYCIIRYTDIFEKEREIVRCSEIIVKAVPRPEGGASQIMAQFQTVPGFGWST